MSGDKPLHELLTPSHSPTCASKPTQLTLSPHRADLRRRSKSPSSLHQATQVRQTPWENLSQEKLVSTWAVHDVEQWVRSKQLHKFLPAVNKYKVTGKDLINLNLNFVYDSDVLPVDREDLLSEVYNLVSPGQVSGKVERKTRYSNAQEQEKYAAAMRIARCRDRSSSPSLVVFSRSPSPGGASVLSVPAGKTRSRSESGVDGMWSDSTPTASPARKYLKRKSTPNALLAAKGLSRRPALFDVFRASGPQCVQCYIIKRGQDGYDFVCDVASHGAVVVRTVSETSPLRVADLILEMNGISLIRGDNSSSTELLLERLMLKSDQLQMVVARQHRRSSVTEFNDPRNTDLNFKLSTSEHRWQQLRDFLVDLKSENVDPNQEIQNTSAEHIDSVKDSIALQEEVQQLQEALSGHATKVSGLEKALEVKAGALLNVERQRDVILAKLEAITLAKSNKSPGPLVSDTDGDSLGVGLYAELMEHLDQETASKEEVLQALRETVKEATTQKTYLDKLMCVVVEEASWLLDIINTDLADLSVQSHDSNEEFC
ncbi:uncharacterized protein LOC124151008 [Haliotis rufescens]|uniref:uncharacterized protein LOC124151008 n=1 Tax=Haliotis rufescens TaxID=6454 RepID=UPI00201F3CFB|nr:uncharacterized protein LOC124151008 [Haliotis rufescens]